MGKFIQKSIDLRRISPESAKHETSGRVIEMKEEALTIIIEYSSSGDTTKISNSEIIDKLRTLLGNEL